MWSNTINGRINVISEEDVNMWTLIGIVFVVWMIVTLAIEENAIDELYKHDDENKDE